MMNLNPRLTAFPLLALICGLALFTSDARGEGVAQVMTSKSLPEATVAVIDPETGTSSGGSGSDVKLAIGDIILFRFEFTPVPDKAHHGMQGYLTEYIPANTKIVGIRLLDANGLTIKPKLPGLALDGCAGGSFCNSFDTVPCSSGTCDLDDGSLAQVTAETGIFYTTDSRLARNPADKFITMDNGIVMIPEPATINPDIADKLLNDNTAPYYAHNAWDWVQARAYGTAGSPPAGDFAGTNGTGNAPYLFGSMVAGVNTGYPYEAEEVAPNDIEMNIGNNGPWLRVVYPGSMMRDPASISVDSMVGNDSGYARTIVPYDPASGFDVTPANPIEGATAIRIALGEVLTGKVGFAEIALEVTDVPIDPDFNPDGLPTAPGGNINCGEVVGSDVAPFGNENPWPTYVGSPACVFLKLLRRHADLHRRRQEPLAARRDQCPGPFEIHGQPPELCARVRARRAGVRPGAVRRRHDPRLPHLQCGQSRPIR
jgi:hypothetical protein